MKKILKTQVSKFFAILIVFVCFFTNTVAENKKIFEGKHFVMATSANFPPLEYVILDENEQNKVVGFDIDLATALSEELGFTYEIMNTQFSSLIGGLQSKRVDFIISGMSPTEERKKSVNFTNGYFFPKIAIISLKGNKEYSTLKSLEGKKIATTFGTSYEKIAQGVKGAKLVSLENSVVAVQEVLSGRAEGAIVDGSHAVEFVKKQPKLTSHLLTEKEFQSSNSSFAIACQKNSILTEEFNKALVTLKENGKLSKIAKKWLGEEGESFIINPQKVLEKELVGIDKNNNINKISNNDEIKDEGLNLHFERVLEYKKLFINGLIISLKFTVLSAIAGITLGTILALIKVSKIKFLQIFANIYTSLFRGTPLLVQLFLVYFATPQLIGYKIPTLNAAVITFGLNSAAYVSEILRGGIQSIDKGQYEAAIALGIPYYKMMKDIIIPQAIKVVLPGLVNEMIALLKESSLVSTIGVIDMMRASQTVMNITYLAFEPFIIVALMYYILVMILTSFANILEGRLRKNDRN
ncbi:MAG: ABC transporter substrate-binding protein/permease [Fusobacterium sp.]